MDQKCSLKNQGRGNRRTECCIRKRNCPVKSRRKRSMKRHALLCAVGLLIFIPLANAQKPFTLEQVMSAPFPANLTAAKTGNRVAWTLDEQGKRNVWVAEG